MLTEVEGDVAGEMECEMQARDFFIHIGMLIVEGRTPQQSEKGRAEGPHCLSLISVAPHVCNPHVNYLVSSGPLNTFENTIFFVFSNEYIFNECTA